jgi:hypothetical protein
MRSSRTAITGETCAGTPGLLVFFGIVSPAALGSHLQRRFSFVAWIIDCIDAIKVRAAIEENS